MYLSDSERVAMSFNPSSVHVERILFKNHVAHHPQVASRYRISTYTVHECMCVWVKICNMYGFKKYVYTYKYIEYNLTKSQQHVQVQNWKLFYHFDFCLGLCFLSGIQHYYSWPFAERMRLIFSSCSATRDLGEPRSMQIWFSNSIAIILTTCGSRESEGLQCGGDKRCREDTTSRELLVSNF